jgi:hypothetical protein
VTHQLEELL